MALAHKRGQLPDASPAVKQMASQMTEQQLRDFAVTKDRDMPTKQADHPILDMPAPQVSRQDREQLIEEARQRHYQDQPFSTAALMGGAAGFAAPALLGLLLDHKAMLRDPMPVLHAGLVTAPLGMAAGMGGEAAGRLLTRGFGPDFRRSQWHRDQDPHRWNSALRTAPLAAALLAGRALPSLLQRMPELQKSGSMLLNPVKRYVSNLPDLYSYTPKHVTDAIKYLPRAYDMVVKDKSLNVDPTPTDLARRELFRRGLEIHQPSTGDIFQPKADGTLQLAPSQLQDGKVPPNLADRLIGWAHNPVFNNHPIYDRMRVEGVKNRPYIQTPTASNVLGNYTLKYKGNGIFNVRDKWDVGLNPGDSAQPSGQGVVGLARRALDSIMKPAVFDQDFQQLRDGSIVPVATAIKGSSLRSPKERVQAAEAQVAVPTQAQIDGGGSYRKGHLRLHGLDITLETASGQERKGVAKDGTPWSVTLTDPYGYIKETDSAEPGDQMDVFIGPHPESEAVFVVDQNKPGTQTFDEHKCVLGCRTMAEAKALYLRNYSKGWTGFRDITPLTLPQFKSWLKKGDMTRPLAGQQFSAFHKQAGLLDKFKRYVSNLPDLYTYKPEHFVTAWKNRNNWDRLAVQDKPYTDDTSYSTLARRELFRRGLGVHTPSANDWFTDTGNGQVRMADRLFQNGKATPEGQDLAAALTGVQSVPDLVDRLKYDGYKTPAGVATPAGSNVLGHYTRTYLGNGAFNVKDRWDFTPNAGETDLLKTDTWKNMPVLAGRVALDKLMKPVTYNENLRLDRDGNFWREPAAHPVITPPTTATPAPTLGMKRGSNNWATLGRGTRKQATQVNWDEVKQRIRAELPGLHVPEALMGGMVGAAGGGLAGYLNGDFDRKKRNRWWRYPLIGAVAGAGAGNLVGDRMRRWLSNISDPFSYGVQRKWDNIRKGGVHGFIQGALMDKPLPLSYRDDNMTDSRMMRRELLRRGLGVHTGDPSTDYFKQVSTHGNSPVLHLADRHFDSTGRINDMDLFRLLAPGAQALPMDSFQFAPSRPSLQNSILFGNFTTTPVGNVTNLHDKWDFDLHPEEKTRMKELLSKLWKQGPSSMVNPVNGFSSEGEELKSLGLRHTLDQTIFGRMPVFDQSFYTVPDAQQFRPPTYRLPHD